MASRSERKGSAAAMGGVLTALGVTLLYVASIAPSGRLGFTALAGLCPAMAVVRTSRGAGYLVWGATSILGLILVPEKAVALGYVTLFGLYPVLKSHFESIPSCLFSWGCKLFYGTAGVVFFQRVLIGLLMQVTPDWMEGHMAPASVLGLTVFVVYDIGLSRLIRLMAKRVGSS